MSLVLVISVLLAAALTYAEQRNCGPWATSGLLVLGFLAGGTLASGDRPVCGPEVTAIGGSAADAQGFDLSYAFDILEGDTAESAFSARIELLINGAVIQVPVQSVVVNTAWDDNSTAWCVGTVRRPLLKDGDQLDIAFYLDSPRNYYSEAFSCVFYHEIIVPTFVSVAERHPYITATITLGSILGFIFITTACCVWWRQRSAYYARERQAKAKFVRAAAMQAPSGHNMITRYDEDGKDMEANSPHGLVATAPGVKVQRSRLPKKSTTQERERSISFSAVAVAAPVVLGDDDDDDEDGDRDTQTLNRQIDHALQSPAPPSSTALPMSAV